MTAAPRPFPVGSRVRLVKDAIPDALDEDMERFIIDERIVGTVAGFSKWGFIDVDFAGLGTFRYLPGVLESAEEA